MPTCFSHWTRAAWRAENLGLDQGHAQGLEFSFSQGFSFAVTLNPSGFLQFWRRLFFLVLLSAYKKKRQHFRKNSAFSMFTAAL